MDISQKTRDKTPYTTPEHLLKKSKTGYSRDTCTKIFIAALFTIAKLWKQPRCLTSEE
jgi:hypothetical protein